MANDDISRLIPKRPQIKVDPSKVVKAPQAKKEQSLANLKASTKKDVSDNPKAPDGWKNNRDVAGSEEDKKFNTGVKKEIALSLRYRVPEKLAKLPKETLHKMTKYVLEQLHLNVADRSRFMQNLAKWRQTWMDFERTGLAITIEGQHDEHIPVVFEKGKAMYARLVNAILGVQPPFALRPNKSVSEKVKQEKEDLLRWVISQYANKENGIDEEIDKDCFNFTFDGTSVTKHYWDKDVRKFVDVKEQKIQPIELDENGKIATEEVEVESERVVYDGPIVKTIPLEDMYFIGSTVEDVEDADLVIHRQFFTKSDIIKMANQGFFLQEASDRVLSKVAPSSNTKAAINEESYLKDQKDEYSGIQSNYSDAGRKIYTVYETYLRYDIDDDGIDEELVAWIEPDSRTILRLTYLNRVSPNGKRPFVLKKLIAREGKPYGIGFAEMLYGLQNTTDYINNQRLDAGMFQIFPWFLFRAGSAIQGEIKIAPGKGVPVDDINDISFPRVNGNPAYGFQEEQMVKQHTEDITGVSALAMGQNNSQGAARTATGASALVNELNANLDIYIKHYQWGFRKNLKFIDKQVQELLPLGLEYRVVGIDGRALYKRFADRDAVRFDCDFEITGNTINSNKAIERDTAQAMLQVLQNPIALQTGLVNPLNLYNAYKNYLQKFEIRDTEAYITRPEGVMSINLTAKDEINMILAGVLPPVMMNDKHAEKLAFFQEFEASPEFALYTEDHLPLYLETKQKHMQLADAIAAQQQPAGIGGQSVNPGLAAQIAAGAGNPQGGVPNQITDLAPQSSGIIPENQ